MYVKPILSLVMVVPAVAFGGCSANVDPITEPHTVPLVGDQVSDPSAAGRHADVCGAEPAKAAGARADSLVAGTWRGTIDGYRFPSGSNAITLTLAEDTDGNVTGTVHLGEGESPPPTDPNVGYPTDVRFGMNSGDRQAPSPPYDDFSYTVMAGNFDGIILSVDFDAREFWRPWCELQNMVFPGPNGFGCVPPITVGLATGRGDDRVPGRCFYSTGTGTASEVDCDKFVLCDGFVSPGPVTTTPCGCGGVVCMSCKAGNPGAVVEHVCDCTRNGCSVCSAPDSANVSFVLRAEGDVLKGTVTAKDTQSTPWIDEGFNDPSAIMIGLPTLPGIGGRKLSFARVR
jgi:hypothetical protein